MTKILAYTLILLFVSSPVFSQKKETEWRYEGPRIGIDLSRLLVPFMQQGNRSAWEIQADMPYKGNFFPTVEMGMQWFDDQKEEYHYKNSGAYGRLGVDLNIVKFESLKDHDFAFVGFRYGYSRFTQEATDILYTNYWESTNTLVPAHTMNAHWAELVFGVKGEIFKNFFLGWSIRAKFPIYITKDENIKPYIIPGIGQMAKTVPVDFSFGVYYRFPIFKTKTIPKPIKMGGATHSGSDDPNDPYNQGTPGSGNSGGSMQNLRRGGM